VKPKSTTPTGIERHRHRRGFSLGEMLATVIIGAMILTAILGIYARANHAADAVLAKVEGPALASEVLRLIETDLDRTLGADDARVQIRNGFESGYARAELVLRRTYHDKDKKEQVLEEITWRAAYDTQGTSPGMVLYRSREGKGYEDRLLEKQREDWERDKPFVPVCRGVTFFQIQAYKGEDLVDAWPLSAAPAGVKVAISFAEPYQSTVRGNLEVADEDKIERTMVINAMRKIKYASSAVEDANQADGSEPASEPALEKDDSLTTSQRTKTQSIRGSTTNARTPTQTRRR